MLYDVFSSEDESSRGSWIDFWFISFHTAGSRFIRLFCFGSMMVSRRCASARTGSCISLPDPLSNPQPLNELRPPLDNLLLSLFFPLLLRMLLSFEVCLNSHISIVEQDRKE
jgi:hypothetical protein